MNLRRCLSIAAIAIAVAPAAFADGVVLPPTVVLRLPEMPIQRALIVHRDGVEKLVVESPFEGEGDDLAWVLPVPSEPLSIDKASAGLFTTLENGLRPRVIFEARWWRKIGFLLIIWSLFILALGRFEPKKTLIATIAFVLVVKWGMSMIPGGLGEDYGPFPSLVKAGEATRAGSCEVRTLEANSAEALNAWLSKNGYRGLPEAGLPIVDDYVAQGWKFVVARLHREGEGLCRPHPLAVSFKATDPVYPMRLTPLAGSDLDLDLFVISDHQVKVDGMETLYSDRFSFEGAKRALCGHNALPSTHPFRFYDRLALPSLAESAWDDCVITWLHGDLSNARMDSDLKIQPAKEQPTRPTVYSEQGVKLTAQSNMFLVAGMVSVAGAVVYVTRKRRWARAVAAVLTLAAGAGCLVGVNEATRRALPHVETVNVYQSDRSVDDAMAMLRAYPEVVDQMSLEEIEQYLAEALAEYRNPCTGEPLAFEEGPGDVVVGRDDLGVYCRTFSTGEWLEVVGRPEEKRITGELKRPNNSVTDPAAEEALAEWRARAKNARAKRALPPTKWDKLVERWWPW